MDCRAIQQEERQVVRLCPVCRHCGLCPGDGKQPVKDLSILAEGFLPELEDAEPCGAIFFAADIGTTTIAVLAAKAGADGRPQILGRKSAPNPQAAYGSDVLSRATAARDEDAADFLRSCVLEKIAALIQELCDSLALEGRKIGGLALTGNTIMLAIAAGLSPESIVTYPFSVPDSFGREFSWAEFTAGTLARCAAFAPETRLYVPPVISAFVGADALCACAALFFAKNPDSNSTDEVLLMADIGTNCETALLCGGQFYCTSSAAGPAFEGANISCGMSAAPGAIARVTPDKFGALRCKVIGGQKAEGLCGSGLLSAVAACLATGAIDTSGRIANADAIELAPAVRLLQRDVRNFQLSKAAVRCGIDFLLKKAGIRAENPAEISSKRFTLFLAGGFGCSLNPDDLLATGMVPRLPKLRVIQAGNAALTGALSMLLSPSLRKRAEGMAKRAVPVNLAEEEGFQGEYIGALDFPKNG